MTRSRGFNGTYKRTKHCEMYITVRHHILVVSCKAHKSWSAEITRKPVPEVVELFNKHKENPDER